MQAGRFVGSDKAQITGHTEIRGPLIRSVEDAVAFVQRHLQRGASIGTTRRKDRWDLPPVTVREAVVNAVVHADYAQRGAPIRVALFDDRLEIESPGLLPFGLTVEDLTQGVSKLRNRVIGRVFHELGLIEQWGSGIQRMRSACREAGLAAPEFLEIGLRFRATLRMKRTARAVRDGRDERILDLLADGNGRTTAELAAHVALTPRATRTRLAAMVEDGLLRDVGSSSQDPKRRYYRANGR